MPNHQKALKIFNSIRVGGSQNVEELAVSLKIGTRTLLRYRQAYRGFTSDLDDEQVTDTCGWELKTVRQLRHWGEEAGILPRENGTPMARARQKHIDELIMLASEIGCSLKLPTVTELSGIESQHWQHPYQGQLDDEPQLAIANPLQGTRLLEHLDRDQSTRHKKKFLDLLNKLKNRCQALAERAGRLATRDLHSEKGRGVPSGLRLALIYFSVELASRKDTKLPAVELTSANDGLVDMRVGGWYAGRHTEDIAGRIQRGFKRWIEDLVFSTPITTVVSTLTRTEQALREFQTSLPDSRDIRIVLNRTECSLCRVDPKKLE